MFDIINSLIGYVTEGSYTNANNYIIQICGSLIILFFVFLVSFVFELIARIFR